MQWRWWWIWQPLYWRWEMVLGVKRALHSEHVVCLHPSEAIVHQKSPTLPDEHSNQQLHQQGLEIREQWRCKLLPCLTWDPSGSMLGHSCETLCTMLSCRECWSQVLSLDWYSYEWSNLDDPKPTGLPVDHETNSSNKPEESRKHRRISWMPGHKKEVCN